MTQLLAIITLHMEDKKIFKTNFLKKEKMGNITYSFYFKKNRKFNFAPGQYIRLMLDIKKPDERGTRRYFTVSSSPTEKEYFTITTKIIKSTFKKALFRLKKGQEVSFIGPIGYFDINLKNKNPKVFLAGGIGITPFHSSLTFLDDKKIKQEITFIVTFSKKEDVIFLEELKKIESKNKLIKIVVSLTGEDINYPNFEKGRIDKNMIKKYVHNIKKSKYFITGPLSFVQDTENLLKEIGIREINIFKEDFSGY